MTNPFVEYFRCPENCIRLDLQEKLSEAAEFFHFGADLTCYSRVSGGFPVPNETSSRLPDLFEQAQIREGRLSLPFVPAEVVENLRRERYVSKGNGHRRMSLLRGPIRRAYYLAAPYMPVSFRKHLQRVALRGWEREPFPSWPVDRSADKLLERLLGLMFKHESLEEVPFIWFWPEGKSSALIMTHDVETDPGLRFCTALMDLDESYGIPSSFQIVPENRYSLSATIIDEIRARGCEVNIHDWNHDGFLYADRTQFLDRARRINEIAATLGANGFRSGALYRNLDWYDAFTFSYDMSVPNVGHLDPQPGGCCTVLPYFIGDILEIPLTTVQDYSLFHILGDYSIDLWKKQLDLIINGHGLASFIVHPDYIREPRALGTYTRLLEYLSMQIPERNIWCTLPGEINRWWRERNQMTLVKENGGWRIEGRRKERARVAYATLSPSGAVQYSVEPSLNDKKDAHRRYGPTVHSKQR